MPLATTRRSGLVGQAIDQLRVAITSGEWPVGQRIPTEPELSAALEVGRNTVREAVGALAHAGLLEVRQGDGTYVRATSELTGTLRQLCGRELQEVVEVRRTLEVAAAELAARRRTKADLDRLRAALVVRNAEVSSLAGESAPDGEATARAARADVAFHTAVVNCAQNSLLAELYRGVIEAVTESVATTMTAAVDLHDESHARIVEAIADRDAARAARETCAFLDPLLHS